MKSWDDVVASGIVPKEYAEAIKPTSRGGIPRSHHFFVGMSEQESDAQGQAINAAIRQARGRGLQDAEEDTPEYMQKDWGWSDEELQQSASFFHSAPKHARSNIEINGLRPNLTSTVGNPNEMKQRFGVFGNAKQPEIGYGLDAAHPDENGVRRADVYRTHLPVSDLRIDPYGYPFAERTIKPHEMERVGHAVRFPGERGEYHEGKEETCETCR
jgi:hypothetical protein